jgi:Dolichyl-phosphate-mannose-protein mannosyltransferase
VPRREYALLGLFALALLPRLLLLAARGADLQFWEYETLATSIAAGQGYVINRFGHDVLAFGDGNLYSFLAGSLYALVGHAPLLLAIVQAVLASLAVPVIFVIGERSVGTAGALVGAALAALHPGLLAYTLKLHPLGIDVLLLVLLVYWSLRSGSSSSSPVVAGLTLGLSAMSRPTFFVAGVAVFGVGWLTRHLERRYVVATLAVAILVPMPWVARNWVALGQPVLISTSFEDIWKGNNELASGSSYVSAGTTAFDVAPVDLRQRIMAADELQTNSIFEQKTLEFVQQRPVDFGSLVLRKFFYFWWLPQQAGVMYPPEWLGAYQVYAIVILSLAVMGAVGIVRSGTADERALLIALATVGMTLAALHALSYVEGRHRWSIEPLLLLLTARGLLSSASWIGGQLLPQSRIFRRLSTR